MITTTYECICDLCGVHETSDRPEVPKGWLAMPDPDEKDVVIKPEVKHVCTLCVSTIVKHYNS